MRHKSALTALATSMVALLLGAIAFPAPAPAASPVSYNWSGFYVGLNAGGGFLNDSGSQSCVNPEGSPNGFGCPVPLYGSLSGSGVIGGAQIGRNWSVPLSGIPTVIGFEGDINGTGIGGSNHTSLPASQPTVGGGELGAPATFVANQNINWMSTARVRIGYAGFDDLLIYATAGVAFGQVDETVTLAAPSTNISYPAAATKLKYGPTAGAGVEYAFMGNLSVKAEGLYYDLGSNTILGPSTPIHTGFTSGKVFNTKGAIFRLGLNYHF